MYINGIDVKDPGNAGYKKMVSRYSGRGRTRFWEIDFLRGLCVTLMIFDHFMYCLWDVVPFINETLGTSLFAESEALAEWYWTWNVRAVVWQIVVTTFFTLCGISCTLTRGNFRRSIPLALVAAGITAITSVIENFGLSGATVLFGVIHMLASGIFLYALLDNAAIALGECCGDGKISKIVKEGLRCLPGVIGIALLVFCYTVCVDIGPVEGHFELFSKIPARDTLAENIGLSIFVPVDGFDFYRYSGDYFPILPWAAFILIGGILGRLIYHTRLRDTFAPYDGAWNSGVCFFGRHAAVVYVSHMVVIPLLFLIAASITLLFG